MNDSLNEAIEFDSPSVVRVEIVRILRRECGGIRVIRRGEEEGWGRD